jgi:NitT/TauT family transport system substrate-binding protein
MLSFLVTGVPPANAATLTIMAAGKEKLVYLPLVLAASLGYFKDEGLHVDITSQQSGIDATTQLLSGAVQGAAGFYDHTIDLQTRGVEIVSLVVFGRSAGLVEVAASGSNLGTMSDIKGKRLGVTGLGSSTYFITRYIAQQAGFSLQDYTIAPQAGGDSFQAAFRERRLDAAMVEEPNATQLIDGDHAIILADMRTEAGTHAIFGGNYAGPCLYVQRAWLDSHRDEAQRLVNALVRSLHYISTHNAQTIAEHLPGSINGANSTFYLDALRRSIPMFIADGRMPEGAPETALKVLMKSNTGIVARHVDLSRTYTNALVDQAAAIAH